MAPIPNSKNDTFYALPNKSSRTPRSGRPLETLIMWQFPQQRTRVVSAWANRIGESASIRK